MERTIAEVTNDERVRPGAAEEAMRKVLDGTTDAIAVHRDGKLVYANPAGLKLLGYSGPEEVIGRSVLEFVAPPLRDIVAKRIFKTYAGGGNAPELEESFLDVGGHEVPVEVLAIPLVFDGKLSTLVHIRDLRKRKELESRLRAADRLAHVGFVAAAVIHEIRGPLGYALSSMELLEDRLSEIVLPERRSEIHKLCVRVHEGLLRVRDVARDVGVFSGTLVDLTPLSDVNDILDAVVNLVAFELRGRARLVKHYGEVPRVAGMRPKLGHVFANLLVNAAQAIPPGNERDNEVDVTTYARDGAVFVEIHDTGVGIPHDKLEAIFEPFMTTKVDGTGLGLPIVRTLIEECGGRIVVRSEPGRGATFVVELRAAP